MDNLRGSLKKESLAAFAGKLDGLSVEFAPAPSNGIGLGSGPT